MKKIFLGLVLFFAFGVSSVLAKDTYNIGEYVYFDPVSSVKCTSKNYWTYYNQDTTCYRWNVIGESDGSSSYVKLMLDHNIAISTYSDYSNQLELGTSDWNTSISNIDIISEEEVHSIMKLDSSTYPYLDSSGNPVSVGSSMPRWMATNTLIYYDKNRINSAGYWTKDLYELDNSYAYTVTETPKNRLVKINSKRGVRPVITIDKSLVVDSDSSIVLSPTLKYSYPYINKKFGTSSTYYYKQMQGFTFTGDRLVFASTNNSNPNESLLFSYTGNNNSFDTRTYQFVDTLGHANDMTYNLSTDEIYIVGPNSYSDIYVYDNESMQLKKSISTIDDIKSQNSKSTESLSFSAIGYDSLNNNYYFKSGSRIYVVDDSYKILYSLDAPYNETGQGIEVNKGYLYVTGFEAGCNNGYQIYYDSNNAYTGKIYVYDVRFNSDGTPTKDFGKLVTTYFMPSKLGELETVSFLDNNMYLGVAAQHYDSTNTYKFYSVQSGIYPVDIDYSVTVDKTNDTNKIIITSSYEIKSVDGWNLSNNSKSISRIVSDTSKDLNVNLCDRYNNCRSVTITSQELKEIDGYNFQYEKSTTGVMARILLPDGIDIENFEKNNGYLEKKYTDVGSYTVTFNDNNNFLVMMSVVIPEYEPPLLSYNFMINNDIIMMNIMSNKEIKAIEGWNMSTNNMSISINVNKFSNIDLSVCDNYDNCTKVNISKEDLDIIKNYSYTLKKDTSSSYVVTLNLDSGLNLNGWQGNGNTYTKKFNSNIDEIITFTNSSGYDVGLYLYVNNAEELLAPSISISYYIDNNDVLVYLTSDDKLKQIDGWSLSDNGYTLYRNLYIDDIVDLDIYNIDNYFTNVKIDKDEINKVINSKAIYKKYDGYVVATVLGDVLDSSWNVENSTSSKKYTEMVSELINYKINDRIVVQMISIEDFVPPIIEVIFYKYNDDITINIKSNEKLSNDIINGFDILANGTMLSKDLESDENIYLKLCDDYNNCTDVNISKEELGIIFNYNVNYEKVDNKILITIENIDIDNLDNWNIEGNKMSQTFSNISIDNLVSFVNSSNYKVNIILDTNLVYGEEVSEVVNPSTGITFRTILVIVSILLSIVSMFIYFNKRYNIGDN